MTNINLAAVLMNTQISRNTSTYVTSSKGATNKGFNQELQSIQATKNNKQTVQGKQVEDRSIKKENKIAVSHTQKDPVVKRAEKKVMTVNKEQLDEVNTEILGTLSQALAQPVEVIRDMLEAMNLEPIALLEAENFIGFIQVVYPEMNEIDMLLHSQEIKDVSKLFSEIETVTKNVIGEEGHLIVAQMLEAGKVVAEEVKSVINIEAIDEGLESSPLMELFMQVQEEIQNDTKQNGNTTGKEGIVPLAGQDMEPMGMIVPIENFDHMLGNQMPSEGKEVIGSTMRTIRNLGDVGQIVEQLDIELLAEQKEIRMQLSPRELGQLSIKLVENSGVLMAEMSVESEKTKAFILDQMNVLKESLEQQGITVGDVQVDVRHNSGQSQMEQQKQKSTKRIQEIIQKHLNEIEEEEQSQLLEVEKNTEIDYMV